MLLINKLLTKLLTKSQPQIFSPLEVARKHIQHDALMHIPWDDQAISLEQFTDVLRASDTYSHGSLGRKAYIDGSVSRLYRVFANLYSFKAYISGPMLDVASGWGLLYPAYKKFIPSALPYYVAEMGGWELTIDGDAIDGCKFECEKDVFEYADETFGLVCFFDCIEHLIVDPIWPLLEFNRVLRMGGRLAISTPNGAGFYKIFQILHGENPATESQIKPSSIYQRHNREWISIELRLALELNAH